MAVGEAGVHVDLHEVAEARVAVGVHGGLQARLRRGGRGRPGPGLGGAAAGEGRHAEGPGEGHLLGVVLRALQAALPAKPRVRARAATTRQQEATSNNQEAAKTAAGTGGRPAASRPSFAGHGMRPALCGQPLPPVAVDGRVELLATHHVGCTGSRRSWRNSRPLLVQGPPHRSPKIRAEFRIFTNSGMPARPSIKNKQGLRHRDTLLCGGERNKTNTTSIPIQGERKEPARASSNKARVAKICNALLKRGATRNARGDIAQNKFADRRQATPRRTDVPDNGRGMVLPTQSGAKSQAGRGPYLNASGDGSTRRRRSPEVTKGRCIVRPNTAASHDQNVVLRNETHLGGIWLLNRLLKQPSARRGS